MSTHTLRSWVGLCLAVLLVGGCSDSPTEPGSVEGPTAEEAVPPEPDEEGPDGEAAADGDAAEDQDDDSPTPSAEGASGLDGDLPPVDPLALAALYGDALEARGVELTDRGGLIDRTDGYEVSADGTHLALYVAPIGERTEQQYIDGIAELARVFLTDVFERWPGLETFDICQERSSEQVEKGYVATVTQIDISREVAETIAWSNASLADLYESELTEDGFTMAVFGELGDHEQVSAARSEARERVGSSWSS